MTQFSQKKERRTEEKGMKFLVLFAFLSLVHAKDNTPAALIWVREPSAVKEQLPEDYRLLDARDEAKELAEQGYYGVHEREAIFHRAGVDEIVSGFDEMDKDMLIMGAKFKKLKALKKRYPMLTEKQLKALQKQVKEVAKK